MSQDKLPEPARDLLAPATQYVSDREDYLGQRLREVGRRIADDQVELFVTGDATFALREQLEALAPDFIAVHDVSTTSSLRLLVALAAATRSRVQTLTIRRQGHGVALAVLQFVQALLGDGSSIRIYSTDINADTRARQQIAQVLLSHSRLAVLLVGELPRHVLNTSLQPWREAIARGPWTNGDLLLVPLGAVPALAGEAALLTGRSGVSVQVSANAAHADDAWSFIIAGWNQVQARTGGLATLPSGLPVAVTPPPASPAPTAQPQQEAPTEPMALDHLPQPPAAQRASTSAPMPVPGGMRWDVYARRCVTIKGAISSCIFDLHSQKALAHAGGRPTAERLAEHGARLLAAITDTGRALGMGTAVQGAGFTVGHHHSLLFPVPGHPGIVLHLVLDISVGNATLARMHLDRIDP